MKTPAQKNLETLNRHYLAFVGNNSPEFKENYFCEKCEAEKTYPEIDLIKNEFICKNCQEVENYPF